MASFSLIASPPALAADMTYSATLNGANEVPPIAATSTATTTGMGMFTVSGTGASTTMTARLYATSSSPITGVHLHCAAPGVNGPVVVPLYASSTGAMNQATTSTSTTVFSGLLVNMTVTQNDIASTTATSTSPCPRTITDMPSLIEAINAGVIYANVHTIAWPAGAARGQLMSTATTTPPATTTPATTTISIHPASSTIAAGSSTYASSTLTGTTTQNATGTVSYKVYENSSCTQGARTAGTKTVASGTVPASDMLTFSTAGTYYWQAVYSGDMGRAAATSTCASGILHVNATSTPPATTTPSTTTIMIHPADMTITAGSSTYASSTLTGTSTHNATGTVTYRVYENNTCTQGARTAGTKTVASGTVPVSNTLTFNNAGTFWWQAVYSGDMHHAMASSTCASGMFQVTATTTPPATTTPATTTLTTTFTPSGPVTTGTAVSSNATLQGASASSATGTVMYRVYTDAACSALASVQPGSSTVTVASGTVPSSGTAVFANAGTYYWQASYSGDQRNATSMSLCSNGQLTVTSPTSTPTTTPPTGTDSRLDQIIQRLQEIIARLQAIQERVQDRLGVLVL